MKNMKKWIPVLLCMLILWTACSAEPAGVQPLDTTVAPTTTATPVVTASMPTVTPTVTTNVTQTMTLVVTPTVQSTVTATPTLKATKQPTASSSPIPTPTKMPEQPALLVNMVAQQGAALEQLDCQQLVLVVASGSGCKLYTYNRGNDGIWNQVMETNGYVGENGVTDTKREGDQKTPTGIFDLGFAFGHDADPTTNYPYQKITPDSYWVDDPASAYYNQWVTGTTDKDWNSAENLWEIKTEYALAVLIEYNYGSATVPGKGSAIFLHVGNEPTAGCVTIPKSDLKVLLGWLDEAKAPQIIISEK